MNAVQSPVEAAPVEAEVSPRWAEDPFGRYEWRWWDGKAWTADVLRGEQPGLDPLGLAPSSNEANTSSVEVETVAETWQTRPEGIGVFLGNLLICTLFPIFALWFTPKYVMRHEYIKAFVCLAVPLVLVLVFLLA